MLWASRSASNEGEASSVASSGGTKSKGSGGRNERITTKLIDALNHPLRRKLLRALQNADGARSPSQLTEILGEDIGNISYHMKVLVGRRAVRKARTRQVRGATENFFVSRVAANKRVVAILADTEGEDGGSRR